MKISVIVPVYNSEKYIARCIQSILTQTYHDWELLLVDDGSTDRSQHILKEYELKDQRIKVLYQNHGGAGLARNLGINNAVGDYIVFVDSDDTIENNYFMLLSQMKTDVVFIDSNQVDESFRLIKRERMSVHKYKTKDEILRSQMTGKIPWGGWRKAVKKDIIHKNNIYYTNHTIGEEAIFSFLVLWYAKDYSFIDAPVYNYIQHDDSLSHTLLDDPWGDVALALKEKLIELNIYRDFASTINAFILTAAAVSLDRMAQKYSKKDYSIKAQCRISSMKKDMDFNYKIDYKNIGKKAFLLTPFLVSGFIKPIYFASKLKSKIS